MSLGLVGCGAVAHLLYAPALLGRDEYRVRYVTDLDPAQAASAAEIFGAQAVDLPTLAGGAEAIMVTTPPSSHAAVLRECFADDRIVLCEKPFMTSADEARALVEEARASGTRLYVGHFRRLFPQVELARTLVGLGLIGDVTAFTASEGGRFTWRAVSGYTVSDPAGGVLWDTGAHTLDMVLSVGALDVEPELTLVDATVERNKPEPSHHFSATMTLDAGGREIAGRLVLSRRDALPGTITVTGTRGSVSFLAKVDDRVRLTTSGGSTILVAERSYEYAAECFDLQLQSILNGDQSELFEARRFIHQIAILEALAHA